MARRTGLITILAIVGAVALGVLASVGAAGGGKGKRSLEAKLIGFQEVPAISTTARGKIKLKIRNSTTIEYRLSYSGLSAPATQAHIHFAQAGVNSGIMLWLCDSATNPAPDAAGTPDCPAGNTGSKATVSGTLDAADVLALPLQGLLAGELAEAIAAIKGGVAYANVHTTLVSPGVGFPGGEIRAQLGRGNRDHD